MEEKRNTIKLNSKLVFLGECSVGKTSIAMRFVTKEFNDVNQSATIGASFLTQCVTVNNTVVAFEIWDTSGQEKYRSLVPLYYRGAQAAIVVYDITDRESFENMKIWIRELHNVEGDHVVFCIVANKLDLSEQRAVSTEEGMHYAQQHQYLFYEASAKSDTNIQEVFEAIALELANRHKLGHRLRQKGTAMLEEPNANNTSQSKCCQLLANV